MSISNTLIIIPIFLLYTMLSQQSSKKQMWPLSISLPEFTQELPITFGVKFKISLSCIITSCSIHMDCTWFPCPHDFLTPMSLRTMFCDKAQIDINNSGLKRDAEKLHPKCKIVLGICYAICFTNSKICTNVINDKTSITENLSKAISISIDKNSKR